VERLAKWYAVSRRTVIRYLENAGVQPLPALPGRKERIFRITNGQRIKIFDPIERD
jgi:hypothetical protein